MTLASKILNGCPENFDDKDKAVEIHSSFLSMYNAHS
jgi:hypothetical protein